MNTCPHCGHVVEKAKGHCPHCGAELVPGWPPPPVGSPPQASAPSGAGSAQEVSGLGVGCLLSTLLYVFLAPTAFMMDEMRRFPRGYPRFHTPLVFHYGTWTINLVPLALVGTLYFALRPRPRYPRFARGLGYCLIVIAVLLLWGLATCRQ